MEREKNICVLTGRKVLSHVLFVIVCVCPQFSLFEFESGVIKDSDALRPFLF